MCPSFCSCLLTGSCFSLLKSGGGRWGGGGGKRRKGVAKWLKPCPAKPDPAFLAGMPASPSHPPPNPTLLCQGGKNITKASKAVNERKDGCGQVRTEENPDYPSYLWKTGCFWGTPWPWRAGVRHKPPHFISHREAVLGNGPAQQDHPRLQLRGFGEMVTHGREEQGRGSWLNYTSSSGSQRGLLGYSPWSWARGLPGGQLRMGVLPDRAKEWGRKCGNWADGHGRGSTQMPTCLLLHARRKSQGHLGPASSLRQCLQGISSAGLNHPELQSRAASFLEGPGDTHLLLHGLVLVEEANGGAEQVHGVYRYEPTQTEMRTSASQRGLPSQESTMQNATDPFILTSWTHLKPLSSPGTNHCCTLFKRETRDFK